MKELSKKLETPKNIIYTLVGIVLAVVVVTLIVFFVNRNKINVSSYIKVEYTGANNYAVANCVVDTDKLYKAMAGNVRDMEKLTMYEELAKSVSATVDSSNISNGQTVQVNVNYDDKKAQEAGIEFNNTTYELKASGISAGTVISLFENVEVVFAGMSPEAYVKVTNKWTDDYLSTLEFTSDKNSQIAMGDVIRISCSADTEELGRHGYIVSQVYIDYTVDMLNSYAQAADIDKNVLNSLSVEAIDTITKQVEDTTFRMMYKASKDAAYLKDVNEESVSGIQLVNTYFLKRKNSSEGTVDNYIYMIYKAEVASPNNKMTVYFAFEYSQGYKTADGVFDIMHDKPENRYQCSNNINTLYSTVIGSKEELYNVLAVQ